jgi:hypothetical protein
MIPSTSSRPAAGGLGDCALWTTRTL